MQALESELKTTRDKEMSETREKMSVIVSAAGPGGAVELAAASARLETKFGDVSQQIVDNCAKFRQGQDNLNAHRGENKRPLCRRSRLTAA